MVPPEDRIIETPSKKACDGVEPIASDDSASQLPGLEVRFLWPSNKTNRLMIVYLTRSASPLNRPFCSKKAAESISLGAVLFLPAPRKDVVSKKGQRANRRSEIRCKRCNWKTTDSARATSDSNMMFRLSKHGLERIHQRSSGKEYIRLYNLLEALPVRQGFVRFPRR